MVRTESPDMLSRGARERMIKTYSSTTRMVHTRGLLVTESPVVSCMLRNLSRRGQKAESPFKLTRKEARA